MINIRLKPLNVNFWELHATLGSDWVAHVNTLKGSDAGVHSKEGNVVDPIH